MNHENVKVEMKGKVAVLYINRPDKLNALNSATLRDLGEALAELSKDENVRAIVITGAGEKAFVAGADIKEMREMGVREAMEYSSLGMRVFRSIENCPKPVIAAVNGFALGGGMELAMACDFIYASENARLGQPEVTLGVTPGFGGTQRLPRLVGKAKAKELLFTGNVVPASEARELGIVNKVLPPGELLKEAVKTAEKIAANGSFAVAQVKRAVEGGLDMSLDAGLSLETQAFGMCFGTSDQKEGMGAFLEKRKPKFKGA